MISSVTHVPMINRDRSLIRCIGCGRLVWMSAHICQRRTSVPNLRREVVYSNNQNGPPESANDGIEFVG